MSFWAYPGQFAPFGYIISGYPSTLPLPILDKYKLGSQPTGFIPREELEELTILLLQDTKKLQEDYEAGVFIRFKVFTNGIGVEMNSIYEAILWIAIHSGWHLGQGMMQVRTGKLK